MAARRLLVVVTSHVDPALLRGKVRERAGDDAEVRIVAPASDVSPLEWLASDEDEAREEAAGVAEEAKRAAEGEIRVEAEVGDTDPVQAIEDALREFPADEVLVMTREGEEAAWLEEGAAEEASERFGVPVNRVAV